MIVIGIDVGGTNTDAVLFDLNSKEILALSKLATKYDDLAGCIRESIENCLKSNTTSKEDIGFVSIGTTHFLNAVLQADKRSFEKVAVIRLCGMATHSVPPFADFSTRLQSLVYGTYAMVNGGYEYDGIKAISEIELNEIRKSCEEIQRKNIKNIVISGVFSTMNPSQEREVKSFIESEFSNYFDLTLSSDITPNIGLLERENAAILNAALRRSAKKMCSSILKAVKNTELACDLYLTQNDGTLIPIREAAQFPIFTFNSGATNTMRGASFLTKEKDSIVVDIGGTSSDFGIITNGLPKGCGKIVNIAGVRMNFEIPDVYSIGLGGGSIIKITGDEISVGPQSVGSNLVKEAVCFGGDTLTATDIAAFMGRFKPDVFDESYFNEKLSRYGKLQMNKCNLRIHEMIAAAIERIKPENFNGKIILVGGGSILVDESLLCSLLNKVMNVTIELIKPNFNNVANAIGAAITKVGAIVDRIFDLNKSNVEEIEGLVINNAIEKGALKESIEIIRKSVTPVSYAQGLNRVVIKVAGNIYCNPNKIPILEVDEPCDEIDGISDVCETQERPKGLANNIIEGYKNENEWLLNENDLEYIAVGAEILGSGGGGVTYTELIRAKRLMKEGKCFKVIKIDKLAPNDIIAPVAFMGAPTVMTEKYSSNNEILHALEQMEKHIGKKVTVLTVGEIGGANSLEPLIVGALSNLPVLDADLCGRAFPCLNMLYSTIKKYYCAPIAVSDEKGNSVVLSTVAKDKPEMIEKILRSITTDLGCSMAFISTPLVGATASQYLIHNSIEKAWSIGKCVCTAKIKRDISIIDSILNVIEGKLLFKGKISNVTRYVDKGFTKGYVIIIPQQSSANHHLKVSFQNEYLFAQLIENTGKETTLATVPDIIAIIDEENESAVYSDEVRYGLHVSVLGLKCDSKLYTDDCMKVVGPRAFGMEFDYTGLQTED